MSLTEQIKSCRTPQEALLLLANAIDELRAQPAAPVDPWEQPLKWGGPPVVVNNVALTAPSPDEQAEVRQQIANAEAQLARTNDPQDVAAISAQLRLLRDTGKPMGEYVEQGERAAVSSDGTTGEVVLKPVDATRRTNRRSWAKVARLHEFIPELTEDQAADLFAKGGPMWLYLGNREAIMAMAVGHRQWLVNEIALDSQAQAQEVGRDILKSEDPVDQDIALQAIEALSEARNG